MIHDVYDSSGIVERIHEFPQSTSYIAAACYMHHPLSVLLAFAVLQYELSQYGGLQMQLETLALREL